MAQQQRRQSATQQLAVRDEDSKEVVQQKQLVDAEINKSLKWFEKVAPAHLDAEQFVALAIGAIHRQPKTLLAAAQSPQSLMVALVDCARQALVVGDTYYLVPFWDKHTGKFVITGMRSYKGEIELIYRSGMVDAVYAYAVRGHDGAKTPDTFRWQPNIMQFPDHVIADDGLADRQERGYLRGAYAYARMVSGGFSPVMVMSKDAILRTRPANAPEEFWGPAWPKEGDNTEAMWIKGPIHRLYSRVPHSAEHMAEMLRGRAVALEVHRTLELPPPGVASIPAPDTKMIEAAAEPEAPDTTPGKGERRTSAATRTEQAKSQSLGQLRRALNLLFAEAKFGVANDKPQRLVAGMLARKEPADVPAEITSLSTLTVAELAVVNAKLATIIAQSKEHNREAAADLARLADKAAQMIEQAGKETVS